MTHILSLISDPAAPALGDDEIAAAADALGRLGARLGQPAVLDPGVAAEMAFEGAAARLAESVARQALRGRPVDVAATLGRNRRKRLLLADMDMTLIDVEGIDELAEAAGVGDEVRSVTARAMAGEIDFATALRARIARMKGLPETLIDEVYEARVNLRPGARTLARTMAAHGALTVVVSGGFDCFTRRVAAEAGFARDHANRLIFRDGRLAGVADPILGGEAKLRFLNEYGLKTGAGLGGALCVGDGANDRDMVAAAGLGVAFRAKSALKSCADARIDHGDLTALLYLQGYGREEFVET